MRIYIAGPMRGIPYYNFPAFDAARYKLIQEGNIVVSPADLDRSAGFNAMELPSTSDWNAIPSGFDFNDCVDRDLQAVRDCEALCLLRGWEKSKGACAEKALAEWLGKTIIVDVGATLSAVREFATGATRDTDTGKIDYEGFLSPSVLKRFGQYMNKHRVNSDGTPRDSDNWQKGLPRTVYLKSAWRHFHDWWTLHRGGKIDEPYGLDEVLCAVMFNVMGYLHEELKRKVEGEIK